MFTSDFLVRANQMVSVIKYTPTSWSVSQGAYS